MTIFLVVARRSGPEWDSSLPLEQQSRFPEHASFMDGLVDAGFIVLGGPLTDEQRVAYVIEAESEDALRATLTADPWNETHLRLETVDGWSIRLDSRPAAPNRP